MGDGAHPNSFPPQLPASLSYFFGGVPPESGQSEPHNLWGAMHNENVEPLLQKAFFSLLCPVSLSTCNGNFDVLFNVAFPLSGGLVSGQAQILMRALPTTWYRPN